MKLQVNLQQELKHYLVSPAMDVCMDDRYWVTLKMEVRHMKRATSHAGDPHG